MAIIPGGQQIRTTSSNVDLTNRGNSLVRSQNQVYTMDDIVETVNASGSGSLPYKMYIARYSKGLSSWSVTELYNNTDLTFTWSNPNAYLLHADVTDGDLIDVNNGIYAWANTGDPAIITGASSLDQAGVQLQINQVDIRQVNIASDGSGISDDTSFSGIVVIKRLIVE